MYFWLTVEKFINLKIPREFSKVPILGNILYFRLFSFLVFKFNPDKKTIKHFVLLFTLFLISYPLPFFLIILILIFTLKFDFLIHFNAKIFDNYFFRHFIEAIFYSLLLLPYSYLCSFFQKIFNFYLIKKCKKNLGKLDINKQFDFLANFDFEKNYNLIKEKNVYIWINVRKKDRYNPDKIIENIFVMIEGLELTTKVYLPSYYLDIFLHVFSFNTKSADLNPIIKKRQVCFLIIYLFSAFINFITFWYSFWILSYSFTLLDDSRLIINYIGIILFAIFIVRLTLERLIKFFIFKI
ncbi:hypothetical protein GOM18_03555 [Mycoplasma hyopneumoniae]|uniref:Uncharacterized protein n=1 Tax=Mesomycoplasma hyopneumoniae (strain 7448) TaxID=262722 RepID=Q4A837_MESH7|nr:hypothetical protein [Mesomycoplasma hyopneumoniae]AAZ53702.2 hypothetical protein MHP7448_0330 [Mesomycoplasma hyopneumoniae 7448]AGQ50956.1 hypothetical protein MHL_3359 [Mesomycoplasma hyopneumoniae 7422]MXR34652.1 hypothetical protein [Mesomycoplasma hyopneumoniae]NYN92355.1 hypothetical protein [Mesomycoplasma hyopneumoniae]